MLESDWHIPQTMVTSGEAITFDNVAPGKHTLTVRLEGNDDSNRPMAEQLIHFVTSTIPEFDVEEIEMTGGEVKVEVEVEGFSLVDYKQNSTPVFLQGHIHLWLDRSLRSMMSIPLRSLIAIRGGKFYF